MGIGAGGGERGQRGGDRGLREGERGLRSGDRAGGEKGLMVGRGLVGRVCKSVYNVYVRVQCICQCTVHMSVYSA